MLLLHYRVAFWKNTYYSSGTQDMATAYLDIALDLAKQAGVIMRKNFAAGMKKDWKDERSPVTETDLAINDLVLREIKKYFPDHSILAEEESDHDESHEYVWICDPVDGTHNFSHGLPTATFALALLHQGEPVLGVILDPFEERTNSRLYRSNDQENAHWRRENA